MRRGSSGRYRFACRCQTDTWRRMRICEWIGFFTRGEPAGAELTERCRNCPASTVANKRNISSVLSRIIWFGARSSQLTNLLCCGKNIIAIKAGRSTTALLAQCRRRREGRKNALVEGRNDGSRPRVVLELVNDFLNHVVRAVDVGLLGVPCPA